MFSQVCSKARKVELKGHTNSTQVIPARHVHSEVQEGGSRDETLCRHGC